MPDFVERGVKVHCLDGRRELDPRWTLRLRALVRDRSIDLVHTHMPYVAAGARLAVRDRRVRFVHTEHNLWDRYRRPTRWANMATYSRNRAVIAVSEAVAESIHPPRWSAGRGIPPVEVVRHGADLASICEGPQARRIARERLAVPDHALVIGSVGNFTEKKDHATLHRGVRGGDAERSDVVLVLVGTGPLEEDVRRLTRDLAIEDRVLFTGHAERRLRDPARFRPLLAQLAVRRPADRSPRGDGHGRPPGSHRRRGDPRGDRDRCRRAARIAR